MSLRSQDGNESLPASNRLSSVNVPLLMAISTVMSIAGMEIRGALEKIEQCEKERIGVAAVKEETKLPLKDAFAFTPITTEQGETVPVRFLDDGFTLQIENRFFQLKSISLGFFRLNKGDIRFNIGKKGISQMGYDANNELVIVADENLMRLSPADTEKIVTHLHASSKDCDDDTVDKVNVRLDLDEKNPLKAVMPTEGSMSVTFWNMKTAAKPAENLTALSK